MIVVIDSDQRKEYAAKQLARVPINAGMEIEIRVHNNSRSLKQNARHWVMMTTISQQMPSHMDGIWHSPEAWHELFKRMFLGTEAFDLSGKIYHAPISSRKLKVKEFADFAEQCEAWAAEHGVFIDANY